MRCSRRTTRRSRSPRPRRRHRRSSEPLQPAVAAEPQPPLQTSQPPPPPLAAAAAAVAAAAVPAAVAAEAGCPYRLRLLHWNVQQTKAADAAKLRAVLRYARAHRYDAVSLNELSNTEEELRAIGAPHGYAHARLLQGAHATRLGVLSSHPLVDARPPLTAGIGHGLLCVRPAAAAGADGAAWPDLCVTHLTAYGEARRQPEVSAPLHALPQSSAEPTVLLGDLNVLSPLDGFVALAGNGGRRRRRRRGGGGGGARGGGAPGAARHEEAREEIPRRPRRRRRRLDGPPARRLLR